MTELYTIGHGTRSLDELTAMLDQAGVQVLVDVRRYPGSRRHPHFGRDRLADELPLRAIAYEWEGEALGGRRTRSATSRHVAWRVAAFAAYADHMDTPAFRASLDDLILAGQDRPIAVMCAETVWWRCHRRLIADALVLRGCRVTHLLTPGRGDPHKLHPNVRRDEEGWPVYDADPRAPGRQDALL